MIRGLLLVLCLAGGLAKAAVSADYQKVVQDTMRITQANGVTTLVWWIPVEFWEVASAKNPMATPELLAQVNAVLGDYVVFALVHARISLNGVSATPRDELLRGARFEVNGQRVGRL